MFTEIIKEYDQRRAELRFRSTHAKQELAKLEKQTATHILNSLNSNVETLHEHQKMIDTQAKMFRTETAKLATQTKK